MQLSLGVGGPAWSRSPTLGEIGEAGSPGAAFIPFCLVPGYGSGARQAPGKGLRAPTSARPLPQVKAEQGRREAAAARQPSSPETKGGL